MQTITCLGIFIEKIKLKPVIGHVLSYKQTTGKRSVKSNQEIYDRIRGEDNDR